VVADFAISCLVVFLFLSPDDGRASGTEYYVFPRDAQGFLECTENEKGEIIEKNFPLFEI